MNKKDDSKASQSSADFDPNSPAPAPKATRRRRPRGKPFPKGTTGNRGGRPRGSLNKSTLLARSLFEAQTKALTDKAIALALAGDPMALKLCMERILPRSRDTAIVIDLPSVKTTADCKKAIAVVIAATAAGELTPRDAHAMVTLIEAQRRGTDIADVEHRLAAIKKTVDKLTGEGESDKLQ